VIEVKEEVISSFSKISNTAPGFDLGDIQSDLPLVSKFPDKIRRWYQFYLNQPGFIWCRENWRTSSPWCCQKVSVVDEAAATQKRVLKQIEMGQTEPKKWTVPQLKNALLGIGISIPLNIRKAGLQNLYSHHFNYSFS
jgi:hypothetical protein